MSLVHKGGEPVEQEAVTEDQEANIPFEECTCPACQQKFGSQDKVS